LRIAVSYNLRFSGAIALSHIPEKPNPPTPLRAREGGSRLLPSPCRRGVGGEVNITLPFDIIVKIDLIH